MYVAQTDQNIADAYLPGGDVNDTITVYAYADLDGDFVGGSFCFAGHDPSPYTYTDLTVLSRSLYVKNGDVQGVPGVAEANVGE
jgi:hypothetical protein